MIGLGPAFIGALGVYYLYTALALGWSDIALAPSARAKRNKQPSNWRAEWLIQAGLEGIDIKHFGAVVIMSFILGALTAYAVFGGVLPAVVVGVFAATFPLASYRLRRRKRQERAQEAWPRMIEEIRVLTGSLGRSIPQALFEIGLRAPEAMQSAFAAGQREWLITTDFSRTVAVLKRGLADATADAALETLLVAHEVGGTDLDQRLRSLAEDRVLDVQGRKDAMAKQAGVRFARWFVLLVPAGMALAGMSVGNGRAAYRTAVGQSIVVFALVTIVVCWLWAGHFMRLPQQQRVLAGRDEST
jgi:tight adherence protein B